VEPRSIARAHIRRIAEPGLSNSHRTQVSSRGGTPGGGIRGSPSR
jgi:hypothetical protein